MSFLTQKMGPLPIWGWGALAAGGTFLILKSGGKKKTDSGDPNDPNSGSGSTLNEKRNITATTTNTNTWDGSQTWGGGNVGFLMHPLPSFGNYFVHMHHDRDRGGWHHGGRRYDGHGFEGHGFEGGGHRRRGGHDDHRGGREGGRSGGRGGRGGRIARSFGPNSSRYRDNNQSSPGNYSRDDTKPTGVAGNSRGAQR